MLYSTRAMIEVFQKKRNLPHYAYGNATMLFLGGLVLGPIVQKHAFGAYWTGVPFGFDLTDNKTLIAFAVWLIAVLLVRKTRLDRVAVFVAGLVTLVVFAIPHSVHGSEFDYGSRAPATSPGAPR
jgi:cytochrome bd-type quinol oxidase subunit 2